MSDSPPSPKRRHILSSINPDGPVESRRRRSRSRSRGRDDDERERERPAKGQSAPSAQRKPDDDGTDPLRPRSTRLKLKKHRPRRRSRSRSPSPTPDDGGDEAFTHSTGRRHRHRHRHRRRYRSPTPPNIHEPPPLDPDAAFRESLFDAMADDEAASYWEHVYGQPIHVYSNEKVGAEGELERMTDEEYAAHVRQRMFEKTHAGLMEEKARREERRKQKAAEDRERRKMQDEHQRRSRRLQEDVEHSLRRGEQRRQRKGWAELWELYTKTWATWDGDLTTLPWPIKEGGRKNINEADVRTFFVQGLNLEAIGESAFFAKLKEERVRWHPDKIQQRLGGRVDDEVMRDVTAIFQIIDRLWGESRTNGA
ncbi:Uncharacterized protein TPAR_02686 [Tolypocladium paradoxum]|uniref:NF-kappa-B inhibitor-like protein 1 n=1 Tax=Tolypocladium paradoxum TaxID=94208 RepID=A0A2S4L3Z9_9HYPO|nr:Uncharacterized protein TPAR_02686 [Tolypocladium paradoxum]